MSNIKKGLKAEGFEVTVINDLEMRPFLNVFMAKGKNIQQQSLGKVFGIIQIEDKTEDVAYLPNLLTQIFKKEYYKNKNKTCEQSFEIALHKMNLALTELAQHEIVEWIGSLNAVISAVCGNEIHFTQIGTGRLLFLKDKKIIKLGIEESKKNENYHPMKTFSSISSGKLKKEDKLILTIEETFKTLRNDEIERHYQTFNSNEFDNIITSTLKNEASNTGMLVINIREEEDSILDNLPESAPNRNENLNFFGKVKKEKSIKKIIPRDEDEDNFGGFLSQRKIKLKEDPNKSPFENEPEIFLKEKDIENFTEKESIKEDFFKTFSEKTKNIFEKYNKKSLIKKVSFNSIALKNWKNNFEEKLKEKKLNTSKNNLTSFFKKSFEKLNLKTNKNLFKNRLLKILASLKKEKSLNSKMSRVENSKPISLTKEKFSKKIDFKNIVLKIDFYKIKNIDKKYLIVFAFLLCFILMFIFLKNKQVEHGVFEIEQTPEQEMVEKNKISNITSLKNLIKIDEGIKDTTFFKNELFLLTENQGLIKYSIRDKKKIKIILPENLSNPTRLSLIESLQIILIIGSNEVFSYSPVTNNFSENRISLPNGFNNVGVGTYLTYLYLMDQSNNQIYRYHRAPGGFGNGVTWMKENIDLSQALSLDVSDSIYIAYNDGKIKKYFQGKLEKEFNLEENFTPTKIKVKADNVNLFALDSEKGKIIKLNKKTAQKSLFQDENFKQSKSFSVDFESQKVFLITEENELLVFNYQ